MKKILLVLPLLLLVGCSSERTEIRNEHDNVICTYKVHYDFFGRTTTEKRIVCGPGGQ